MSEEDIVLLKRRDAVPTPSAPRKIGSHTQVASLSRPKSISPAAPDAIAIMRSVAETRPKTFFSTPVCSIMEAVICMGIAAAMVTQSKSVISTMDAATGMI